MIANRGGQLFVGSLVVAGFGAFGLPVPYRWVAIAWLAFVGGVLAVANWTRVAVFARRGRAPSMSPLVGNSLLLIAGLAVPVPSFRGWTLVTFAPDPWLVATLIGLGNLALRDHRNDSH